jgi:hypothetical protein
VSSTSSSLSTCPRVGSRHPKRPKHPESSMGAMGPCNPLAPQTPGGIRGSNRVPHFLTIFACIH